MSSPEYRTYLRDMLLHSFSEEDLRILCADLGEPYDDLAGPSAGRRLRAQNLVEHFDRRNELSRLLEACRSARPRVEWQDPPKPTSQRSSAGAQRRLGLPPPPRPVIPQTDADWYRRTGLTPARTTSAGRRPNSRKRKTTQAKQLAPPSRVSMPKFKSYEMFLLLFGLTLIAIVIYRNVSFPLSQNDPVNVVLALIAAACLGFLAVTRAK